MSFCGFQGEAPGGNAARHMGLRKPYSKVLRESRGHFSKSVLLCGFGSEAPGGNAAGQHGFAEAIMFSERGFGGEAPDYLCPSKKTRKRFLFLFECDFDRFTETSILHVQKIIKNT